MSCPLLDTQFYGSHRYLTGEDDDPLTGGMGSVYVC